MTRTLGAILVGGRATRMGGADKGLLASPSGEALVPRLASLLAKLEVEVVLVGDRGGYASLELPRIPDDPRSRGPLAGLLAAVEHAPRSRVVLLACDLPFVTEALLARLISFDAAPAIVLPRRGEHLEPLFARYDAERVRDVAIERAARGDRSLKGLVTSLPYALLPTSPAEDDALDDWDTEDDVRRPRQ